MFFSFWPNTKEFSRTRKDLTADLIAGITVAIVALPLAIGFGITSGMSAAAGLTTAIIAGFLAALFGGSKYQVSGPTGAMTVILIPVIQKYGPTAIPALGVMAGAMVVLMAIFKLGAIINRVPWAVVEGFTVGIALVISLQQIPLALGIAKGDGDKSLPVAWHTIHNALDLGINKTSLMVVVLTLAIKFSFPRLVKSLPFHIPASFVSLFLVTIIVKAANIDVATIGSIPRSIGNYQAPTFADFNKLLIPALWIALLAAVESLLSARVADGMTHEERHFEPNRELFGQGIATVAASVMGGMPATGAIARTSVSVRSHAKSRMASIFHAVVLLLIALIAAPLVSYIPTAAIAGVLLGTSYRILNPASIVESLHTTKPEAATLVVTAVSVLAIDLIWGMAIGIALHLILDRIKVRSWKA
jgi:SulP family sulfate permease